MSEDKDCRTLYIGDGIQYYKSPNLNELSIFRHEKEGFALEISEFSNEIHDFIARYLLLQHMVKTGKKDVSKVDITMNKDAYINESIQLLVDDPVETMIIDHNDIQITRVADGVARLSIGGKEVLILEAKKLTENTETESIDNSDNGNIQLNSEVWRKLENRGFTQEVFTIDHYTPFTLERIAVRVVFENMPTSKAATLLNLFKDVQKESQILTHVNDNKLAQSEAEELIRNVRIEKVTNEMVKWKKARNKERNLPWDQRAGRVLGGFFNKLKGEPLEHSKLANPEDCKINFFKGIERYVKGVKVF